METDLTHTAESGSFQLNGPRFKKLAAWVTLTALGMAAIFWVLVSVHRITEPRVVTHATMPNGVEMMIKQTFTWSGDLFNTSFYYRLPGGEWVWRYYSHEDGYWAHGSVTLDESSRTATVDRSGKATIKFNWETLAHTQFTETQDGKPRTFAPENIQ